MQRQVANLPPGAMDQAMKAAASASPEDLRRAQQVASTMTPEALAAQTAAATSHMARQASAAGSAASAAPEPSSALARAARLKDQGNAHFGQRRYERAIELYAEAVGVVRSETVRLAPGRKNEERATLAPSAELAALSSLRRSCQNNLASCFLAREEWQSCVLAASAVLAEEPDNRKALYRRGQARLALGRKVPVRAALVDLRRAQELSPRDERAAVGEKIAAAAEALERLAREGAESGDEEAEGKLDMQRESFKRRNQGQDEGSIVSCLEQEGGEEEAVGGAAVASDAVAADASTASDEVEAIEPVARRAAVPDASHAAQAAQMMRDNPAAVRQAASMMSSLSDEQLMAQLRAQGAQLPPGFTPAMARSAAAAMGSMSPEHIASMAEQAARVGVGSQGAPATASAASVAVPQDPETLRGAAAMLKGMDPATLEAMAGALPSGPGGQKIDTATLSAAAAALENMSSEDIRKMTEMAAQFGGGVPGMGMGGESTTAAPFSAPSSSSAASSSPAPFDPSALLGGGASRTEMLRKMADPQMLKMAKKMLETMPPETLEAMGKQAGVSITPEMVKKITSVSDENVERLAKLGQGAIRVVDAFQSAKQTLASNAVFALALLVLLLAIFARWKGWV